jgi:hypothetical protein
MSANSLTSEKATPFQGGAGTVGQQQFARKQLGREQLGDERKALIPE